MPRGHYLAEGVKDAIWELRADGVSEAEIGRQLAVPKRTVSKYLQRVGDPAEVPSLTGALLDARRA